MCPLYPFHVIILYLCLLLPLLFAIIEGADELAGLKFPGKWNLTFNPEKVTKLQEFNQTEVKLTCHNCPLDDPGNHQLVLSNNKPEISSVWHDSNIIQDDQADHVVLNLQDLGLTSGNAINWSIMFNISGKFLGFDTVQAKVVKNSKEIMASRDLSVAVVRRKTIQSKLFSYSVAVLISLAYINLGCALDLQVVKKTLKRPIGPAIGFICQFLIMPLLSYGLGFVFGSKATAMRLGLFVTGTSPGGGASNIWTVMFGGNLDLSVTMTAVSTFAAFFMMPLWIFTLGATIFDETNIVIPYYKICIYAFFLVVPLSIGLAISRFAPKVSKILVKTLKPVALFLIMFIIVFGVWANLYIFKLMTWQVFLVGMGLPWLGFMSGCGIAMIFKRPVEDVIAIAIETGVQNTGMSIFILWFTLDQPLGDMTAVLPVAAATMTPLPLLAALIVMKIKDCFFVKKSDQDLDLSESDVKTPQKIIKNELLDHDDFKESESKHKLVNGHGDANDNIA